MTKTHTTLLTMLWCLTAIAQFKTPQNTKTDYYSSLTDLPLQVSLADNAHLPTTGFPDWLKTEFVKNNQTDFILNKEEYDQLGYKHGRYRQYYKGYLLDGTMIISHSKAGEVKSFNGDWFQTINPSNAVSISEAQALQSALKKVNAKRYKWQNEAETQHMREVLNNPAFSYEPVAELVILPQINERTKTTSFHYAYKFNIYAEEPLYRAYVYVDASNGNILKEHNLICTIDAVGSANTKYSGTQSITTDSYASGYRLREAGRGQGIETYNLNNSSSYTNTDFTNTTNTWTITTTNQAATDAHWGAEKTYDYYMQTFNRNSIDGNGYKLLSYVHYSTNYVNAFWDGQRMTYGDGSTSQGFTIMTALDVCGHEITHGLVENTANLGNGEAGALNEGFADIFGTSVEWFARPSQHDWLMGKDIMTNGAGIRNMANPNAIQQPDTYQGTYWDASGEVHTNNGPCIYWFYLLSVGGTGTNDKSQAYNVTGISMASAQAIAYRALTTYMTPSTNYANVRNYTIQAAKDLFGACSNEVIQTTNAWYAVGVGAQYVAGAISPDFAADMTSSCTLPLTVNFNNTTAAGTGFSWDFGDGATSTSTNAVHTYTANGNYTVKLVANGCVNGSRDSLSKTSYISINAPSMPNATDVVVCTGNQAALTATGNSINWYDAPGGNLVATGNAYTTPTLTTTTTYYAASTVTHAPLFGGPATNAAFGGGSNFNANSDRYLMFDVIQPCVLQTVRVYSGGTGNRTIELRDAAGTVLQSTVVSIPTGTQTIALNFSLTPGTNYQLGTSGTNVNMWRNNTGSGYPFNIGGLVNITNSDAGSSYYYYFYNWQLKQEDCLSAYAVVTASVSVCTGVQALSENNSVQIYPNPASDVVTVLMSKSDKPKQLAIYDALGKIVFTQLFSSEQLSVPVKDFAQGVYTLQVLSEEGKTVIKFIKE